MLDKHYGEQEMMLDELAERLQTLGGVARALAHEFVLKDARPLSRAAAIAGDNGTNDLIVSQLVRGNELQSWFVLRHLAAQTVES